jgi:hypothetical protein
MILKFQEEMHLVSRLVSDSNRHFTLLANLREYNRFTDKTAALQLITEIAACKITYFRVGLIFAIFALVS